MKYPAPLENSNHCVYSNPQIATDVSKAIHVYTPATTARHLWSEEMAEFARIAVTDFEPLNGREASAYMSVLAGLLIHTIKVKCLPLERRVVFDGRNVDAYYKEILAERTSGWVTRGRLLRLAAELYVFDPARRDARTTKRKSNTFLPYKPAEITRLRSQGSTRSTAHQRHNWKALVALGVGCGTTSTEAVQVTVSDIVLHPHHVEVHVPGSRPRVVICSADWEDNLREAVIGKVATDYLILTTNRPTIGSTWVVGEIRRMSAWDTGFTMERLRSTFIVNHLEAGTSPVHLLRMLGVHKWSTIERLVGFANIPSVEDSAALLRIPRQRS